MESQQTAAALAAADQEAMEARRGPFSSKRSWDETEEDEEEDQEGGAGRLQRSSKRGRR
jgi:hypothetical protein